MIVSFLQRELFLCMNYFYSFFLLTLCQVAAQADGIIKFRSEVKTVLVELTSFNQLHLIHADTENQFILRFSDHTDLKKPAFIEKDNLIKVKVEQQKGLFPGAQQHKYRAGQPLYPNYILEVPEDIELKIIYKKGNLKTVDFSGNLQVYLDHGHVDVATNKGNVFIQSYDGVINCTLENTSIIIEKSKGTIESDLTLLKQKKTKTSLSGIYGDPLNKLHVKTVNAKVRLMPVSDK